MLPSEDEEERLSPRLLHCGEAHLGTEIKEYDAAVFLPFLETDDTIPYLISSSALKGT